MRIKWWHILIFVAVVLVVAMILRPGLMRTGWMHYHSGNPNKAVHEFMKLYEKDPNNPRAISLLARALESASKEEQAEDFYKKLVELKPNDANFNELVRFFAWTEQPEKAKETYEQWYALRKKRQESFDNEEGLRILNDLYAYDLTDKNFKEAIEILKALKPLDPDRTTRIDNDLITLYERTGDLDATVAHLEKILERDSDNEYALYKFMELAEISDKVNTVEQILIANLMANPSDDKAWKRLIDFETRTKNYDSANEWYERWLETKSSDDDLKKSYVAWLLATDQQQRAIRYLQRIDRTGKNGQYYNATLFKLYEWSEDKEALFKIYLSRFNRNPRDRQNAKRLLDLVYDLKRYDVGEKVLNDLVRIYPDDPEYALLLDDLYDLEKEPGKSIAVLERAAKETDDPKVLKRLGERYLWNADRNAPTAPAQSPEERTKPTTVGTPSKTERRRIDR